MKTKRRFSGVRMSEEDAARLGILPRAAHPPAPAAGLVVPSPPKPAHPRARGQTPAGTMNKTEAAYAQLLEARLYAREIAWWRYEALKLRLADGTFYTPDFAVMLPDGLLELHEVKGYWQDDARVKIKVAAALFPFLFVAVVRDKTAPGGWAYERFG